METVKQVVEQSELERIKLRYERVADSVWYIRKQLKGVKSDLSLYPDMFGLAKDLDNCLKALEQVEVENAKICMKTSKQIKSDKVMM